jgi:hypothetical protein
MTEERGFELYLSNENWWLHMTQEVNLTDAMKMDLNMRVSETLATLIKITHSTNRIKELEEELSLNRKNLAMSNNLLIAFFIGLSLNSYFSNEQSSVWFASLLFVNMALIATWATIKISCENTMSRISDVNFIRKQLELDVGKFSILQVDLYADYTSRAELAKAETETREYLLLKYKYL